MVRSMSELLSIILMPLVALITFIRGKSSNDYDRLTASSNEPAPRRRTDLGASGGLFSFFLGDLRKTGSIPSNGIAVDNPEDVAAKAIADSLVTQSLPNAMNQAARRRSVRISQMRSDDDVVSVKSPTSAAVPLDIVKKARLRASGTSKPLVPLKPSRKTLILDLDETLIHSLSKGGKITNGHMIEVKLGTHAILYYVYKRPYCDTFLEKVSEWYDVVIFTASVQEYADPVIDWLEQDRKFFKARYYRQHCTYRYGAYMKDLSIAQPDLSRAIIVDNSPLSYRMNEDNAIPIEGWISDPSDRDLLYLIPVLQNLHFIADVRSLLSLRQPD